MIDVIVDLSHHNATVDFAALKAAGKEVVIHKATQGLTPALPLYQQRKAEATAAGLLWGAYHFGDGSDGAAQAQNFLQAVGTDPSSVLMVLDFESNPAGPSMTLDEARTFVATVQQQTGVYPGFYSGHDIKNALGNDTGDLLAQCWFWLAQYGPTPVVPPNWKTWTMWQYTDGSIPSPSQVPGVGYCDQSRFNGSDANLRKLWVKARPGQQ